MANTQVVKVKVEELTKYGYKANGKFVNYSKQLSEADKARVVPGAEFEAELYVADSGKEYLNKILATVTTAKASAEAPTVADSARAERFTPKFEKKETATMSKAEWQQKDRSQLIGGLSHDAATITAALVNVTSLDQAGAIVAYGEILDAMLKIRDEVK